MITLAIVLFWVLASAGLTGAVLYVSEIWWALERSKKGFSVLDIEEETTRVDGSQWN